MANLLSNMLRLPLTEADLEDDQNVFEIPADVLQLQVDMLNVIEGRVELDTFDKEYQDKIVNYYRFSATRLNTNSGRIAKRTGNTLEII